MATRRRWLDAGRSAEEPAEDLFGARPASEAERLLVSAYETWFGFVGESAAGSPPDPGAVRATLATIRRLGPTVGAARADALYGAAARRWRARASCPICGQVVGCACRLAGET